MKKTLLLLVALITATIAFAKTEINGIYYNLNNSTQTAEVTYQYQSVWAGDNYSGVTSITIPEKVTYNSTEYSVTSIGNDAFRYCHSLTSIIIPNSVTSIGSYAFSYCSSLTSIKVNANNPNYTSSDGVLYNKDITILICCPGGKTSITIPNSVTSIGDGAFSSCSRLTSITIEANIPPTLGTSVFEDTNLAAIYIPDNTLSVYKEAWGTDYIFVNNENTLTIHVETPGTLADKIFDAGQRPAFVTTLIVTGTLNDDDFTCMRETMTSLVDVDLSAITNTTGVNFNNKSKLLKILLPENLTSIGNSAFSFCSSLTSITIPNSVTSIREHAFSECYSLTSVSISNSVTYIGNYAFNGCSSLTSITIPNSVNFIGNYAFQGCSSLTSITIPNGVTSIREYAFYKCSSLTSITIPNSVTSIGDEAFYYCSSLTSITIPNSVTSIGNSAFSGCSSLTSITIPNSVTSIGDDAFSGCSSLTSITCLSSTPPEASDLGAPTSTCTLTVPKEVYNSYLRHAYWGQFLTIRTIGDKEIKTAVNNSAWGKVTGAGVYNENDEATLTATANSGYRFVKWSDEVTDNPRTVVVTQDSTFTAIFEANSFAITTMVNDDAMGSVTEGGEYAYGTEITLTATSNGGYRFAQWSDGSTDNPRIVTVTENKTYTAEFEVEVFGVYAAAAVPSMGGVKVTLTAEPIEGLVFDHWSDGNTENPRTLTLTEDIELYAYFKVAGTNLETSKISSANIYTTNGTLHIEGATTNYHILDAAGRLIYSGNATTLTLPRGIYLITMGGEVEKIVL